MPFLQFKIKSIALLLIAAAVTLFAVNPLFADSHQDSKSGTIIVRGDGEVSVVPDEIRFVVGVDAKAPTVQQAYSAVEEKMQQAMKILRKLNIASKDIQALNLSLNPIIDYKQRDRIIAHDARRDIAVKVSDMATYAKAMQQLAEVEVTRFQQVQLASSEQDSLELKALERAYENAELKATQLANKAGQRLGPMLELIEQGAVHSPNPRYKTRVASAMMADSAESVATVSSGMIIVRAHISATFASHP